MSDAESAHVCLCVTLYNFQGQNDKELSFTKGEYVKVCTKFSNWWGGVSSKEGRSGYFPSNYVQDIRGTCALVGHPLGASVVPTQEAVVLVVQIRKR